MGLLQLFVLGQDAGVGFFADVVLDHAGILVGVGFGYADGHEVVGQVLVALVDPPGDGCALVGEMDGVVPRP